MKRLLLSICSIVSLTVSAQISDLPVTANPTTVCSGENSDITLTGSETDVIYTLRNSANATIGSPQVGTGSDLVFNTGTIASTETFNVYATPNFHSAEFDGVDDYAQVSANNRGINSGMTIGAWIKTSLTGVRSYVASKYTGAIGFLFYVDVNGKMKLDGRSQGSSIYRSSGPSLTTVNDGQWHYVAGSTNGDCWNVFVDGVLESTVCTGIVGGLSSGNTAQFRIGMHNFANYFDGEIDDLSLYNTPLTAATISSYYTTCLDGTEPNCTAHFNFDEASGTLIDDSPVAVNGFHTGTYVTQGATACAPAYGPIQMTQTVTITVVTINDETLSGPTTICGSGSGTISTGNSSVGANYFLLDDNYTVVDGPIAGTGSSISLNTGTISSTTTFSVNASLSSSGPSNSSLSFDGVNDYVNCSGDYRSISNAMSVGCWVKSTTSGAGSQFLVTKYDLAFQSGFVVIMDGNGFVKIDGKGYGGSYLSSGLSATSVNDGQWHYVVGTASIGGYFKIYVDGILENTGATSIDGSVLTSAGDFLIGRFDTNYANAEIDEVDYWASELTVSEIQSNMNTCLDVNDPSLVGYFMLNEGTGTTTADISITGIPGTLVNMTPATDWLAGLPGGCLTSTGCNLTMTQQVTVTIDNDGPIADAASLADATGQCAVTSLVAPTATDYCSGSITGTHNATFPITSNTTVTWTYDDGDGNTSTQTQNVVIDDNTAPLADIASLSDLTAQCEITSLTAPTATDNCVGTINGTHNASLPISSNTTITWTYDDGEGNTSTQTQNVVISDNTAPTVDAASLSDITAQCSVTSLSAPTATDNCVGIITGTHNATFPITASTAVTWTYDDGNGNTTTQTQNVVINDNTAPVPTLSTLPDVTDQCSVTSLSNPGVTDNCSAVLISSNAVLPITTSTTITWSYTDVAGNTSTQTQNIVINDNTDPIPNSATLADLMDQCSITSLTAPMATDNCAGTITGTHTAFLPLTTSTIVTWTYDDGNGNIVTQLQNVVINDNTLPIADNASLSDLTAACEITALTPPTATDNCIGAITGTSTTTLPISASTTITWNYNDGNGNIATQTQNVIIIDNVAPVADLASLNDINETCEVTTLTPPTANDNCLGTITGVHNVTLPISSSTLITWTYDDGNGNVTTQNQQVNITDAIAPVADVATLADIVETCEVTTLSAPTASDNCIGQVVGTHNATLPITTSTLVTWTYEDGNGNTSTQDQQVTINSVDAGVTVTGETITADNATADSYQWVDCNNGNAPITGATNQTFVATSNGSYAVEVTTGSCTETSVCETISTIGIDEQFQIVISVYPNPAIDIMNISTEAEIQNITIYNAAGSIVQRETVNVFSVENLAPGSYTLKIETDLGLVRKRFVKE